MVKTRERRIQESAVLSRPPHIQQVSFDAVS
jgi:hypothetical protein